MPELPFAKKSLGQHWLTDPATLQAICDAATIAASDTVLEIGPGLGTLTKVLTEHALKVVAVELDNALAGELQQRLPAKNLEVVATDILRFDLTALPTGYKVVANIPYYLTSNLIRILSESANPPRKVALLVQKEVAERVAAAPGGMSLLSVTTQFYWEVTLGLMVPAKLFTPPPKVDSQVLVLTRHRKPLFGVIDRVVFFRIVKAGFSARRKTLLNSLSGGLALSKQTTISLLEAAKINPERRAQTLSLPEWYDLYVALQAKNT